MRTLRRAYKDNPGTPVAANAQTVAAPGGVAHAISDGYGYCGIWWMMGYFSYSSSWFLWWALATVLAVSLTPSAIRYWAVSFVLLLSIKFFLLP